MKSKLCLTFHIQSRALVKTAFRVRHVSLMLAVVATAVTSALPQTGESVEVQRARSNMIAAKRDKVFYTTRFNLDDLPHYKPGQRISGTIRLWGLNYITDGNVARYWEEGFRKYHPDARIEYNTPSALVSVAGLITGKADLAATRPITFDELLTFQRVFNYLPTEIDMVTGSFNVSGWAPALAIFVHKDNPLTKLTVEQLDGIFGAERSGGWEGLTWHPEFARGPEKNIRTWGELGLTGEWKDKPINIYGGNFRRHEQLVFERKIFQGGTKWNEKTREYANYATADGKLVIALDQSMEDLSKDRYGISYNSMAFVNPQIKALAVAPRGGGPYIELTIENVQNRTYPIFSQEIFLINRQPGQPVDPRVKEYVRYVLSREGQQDVVRDGKFLPLTAAVIRRQLKKLE